MSTLFRGGVLSEHRGNVKQIAERLGYARRHLYPLLDKFGIDQRSYR